MLASKTGSHFDANPGDDTITFHEPMQYLDTETKDLVMNIVCDKMRQLEHSTAPPSLVQALVNHAQAQSNSESASMEDLKEARAQLADAQNELRKARIRMEEAEELSRKFEERLRVAEDVRVGRVDPQTGVAHTGLNFLLRKLSGHFRKRQPAHPQEIKRGRTDAPCSLRPRFKACFMLPRPVVNQHFN